MTARMIMKLRVAEAHYTTADVLHLTFRHPLRPELPGWTAGAHVDVRLPESDLEHALDQLSGKDHTR